MFPVLFAIPRTAGWIAQWEEMLLDPDQKIARPRQIYIGPADARLRVAREAALNRLPAAMTSEVAGSPLRHRVAAAVALLVGAGVRQAQTPRRGAGVRRRARARARPPAGRDRPARRRDARRPEGARLHHRAAEGPRADRRRAGVRRRDAARPDEDGQPARDAAGPATLRQAQGSRLAGSIIAGHYDTKLFREFTLRRRQRRRLEHGVPDRARARPQGPRRTRCRSSSCSSTAKKRSSSGTPDNDTPTAAATTSRRRARPARCARSGRWSWST